MALSSETMQPLDRASGYALAALLVLRLPILVLAGFGLLPETPVLMLYLCGTYLLTGLFLYRNRGRLAGFT